MTLVSHSELETYTIGKSIGQALKEGDVLALQGTLGAGKTSLTKGIAQALGISDDITSPTFTLINEYTGRLPLYHMDVYRLETNEDFLDLGAEELLYATGVCVIEWSEKIMSVLPAHSIIISISIQNGNERHITIKNWPYGVISQ